MAVEPTSLAVLACERTGDRSSAAWQQVLKPWTALQFVVSDAAKGIAGAVQAVAAARAATARAATATALPLTHGLDVFHTAQEAQRVLAGPWRRAEAAWELAEAADTKVAQAKHQGRDARGLAQQARRAWEHAERLLAVVDRQEQAWQRARAALAVFREDGQLNTRAWAEAEIEAALTDLRGAPWSTVRNFLSDRRCLAFLDRLQARLAAVEPDAGQREGWVRRWWLRSGRSQTRAAASPVVAQVQGLVDEVIRQRRLRPAEQLAYERVASVLRTTVRASSAVEGINSVLRMQQGRHRQMTQGLLNLKRLYWNCRALQTGKRRGKSPYEMLGLRVPKGGFWALLQMSPQQLTQELSTTRLVE